jgi:competence protein ComEA
MSSFTVSRRRALAAALLVVGTLLVAARMLVNAGAPTATPAEVSLRPAPPAPRPMLTVHVVGAVRRPGLYRLRDGERIADAVARAGGPTRRAELALINLAAPLADGAQVVVPRRASPGAPVAVPGSPPPVGKVSLNQATLEQLDALPGVGPVTAQKILDFRQEHGAIASVDELDAVPGIGPARLEQLQELVTP